MQPIFFWFADDQIHSFAVQQLQKEKQSSRIIQVVVRQLLGSVFRQLLSGSCLAIVRQSSFLKQFSARFQDVIGLEKKTSRLR